MKSKAVEADTNNPITSLLNKSEGVQTAYTIESPAATLCRTFLYAPDFMEIHEAPLHIVDGRAYSKKVSAAGGPKGGALEACGLFGVPRILHFFRNSREGGRAIKRCWRLIFLDSTEKMMKK